jgi:hypothetical protein
MTIFAMGAAPLGLQTVRGGDDHSGDCLQGPSRQCQRDSGTGHQSHLTFVAAEVKVEGEASHWQTVGDGGTVKRRGFCPTCGSPVSLTFPDMPDVFIVTPASLDDPGCYQPQLVSWTAAGHAWDHLDPGLPKFDKMPTT